MSESASLAVTTSTEVAPSTTDTSSQVVNASETATPGSAPQVSQTLYLYTFLGTLLLLLSVSITILTRSYILRRRFRRRFEEVLRNGQVVAPLPGRRKKVLGPKPRIWDVCITPTGDGWHKVMPLTAEIVPLKRPEMKVEASSSSTLSKGRLRRLLSRTNSEASKADAQTQHQLPTPQAVSLTEEQETIRIATLIAMPSSLRPNLLARDSSPSSSPLKGKGRDYWDGESNWDRMPPLMFGVTDVGMRREGRPAVSILQPTSEQQPNSGPFSLASNSTESSSSSS